MLNWFVFILYLLLFCYLIIRIGFFKNSGINKQTLLVLFLIKIMAALGYAYFYKLPAYHANSDTYRFFNYSITETDFLLHSPIKFFTQLFSFGYDTTGNIFIAENSYWNDLKSNVIIKLLALCNVFTLKNYYANIIIFNFLFFFGIIAFYRLMKPFFEEKSKILIISVFLIPSFLFWCSGIHKDGLIFSAVGMIFYWFDKCLTKGFNIQRILPIMVLLLLIFALRNYVCFALIICLIAWYIAFKSKKNWASFTIVYSICLVAFFVLPQINKQLNFPGFIVSKQQEFKLLVGGSMVQTKNLQPSFLSFVDYLPTALQMVFFRPQINEITNKSYLPAITENLLILFVFVLLLFYKKTTNQPNPLIIACLFFAVTILIITGYTVTFSGAIVRYKSFVLPFLLVPISSMINFEKLTKLFKNTSN